MASDFVEHDYLVRLRDTFRQRMQEEDFCIGERQVERLFQELLERVSQTQTEPNCE